MKTLSEIIAVMQADKGTDEDTVVCDVCGKVIPFKDGMPDYAWDVYMCPDCYKSMMDACCKCKHEHTEPCEYYGDEPNGTVICNDCGMVIFPSEAKPIKRPEGE